jgi:hypothetical protein
LKGDHVKLPPHPKSEQNISKLYRRMITSNDVKAFMIFEKLNTNMKVMLRKKLGQNGSERASHLLKMLQD